MSSRNIAIFDLAGGENGFTHYSAHVLDHMHGVNYLRFHSQRSSIALKKFKGESYRINSYTSVRDVFLKTAFILPWHLLRFFSMIRRKQIAAVYFPYFNHWNLFFALIAKVMRVPITTTVHDGRMHLGERNPITQFEMNSLVRLADNVIVLSKSVRSEIENLVKGRPVHMIPFGMFSLPGIEELDTISSCPTLLLVGHISRYKGVELLCQAMTEIDEASYHKVVIAGEANYKIHLPVLRKLEFHNYRLSDAQLAEFVNAADIMVFPYIEATQSGALTLAIQGTRPIICTNVGGLAEQVTPDEACLVPPTASALSAAIKTVVGDTQLRQRMRDRLREKKRRVDWPMISKQIEGLLNAATDNAATTAR